MRTVSFGYLATDDITCAMCQGDEVCDHILSKRDSETSFLLLLDLEFLIIIEQAERSPFACAQNNPDSTDLVDESSNSKDETVVKIQRKFTFLISIIDCDTTRSSPFSFTLTVNLHSESFTCICNDARRGLFYFLQRLLPQRMEEPYRKQPIGNALVYYGAEVRR
jgi:hypothetical protein